MERLLEQIAVRESIYPKIQDTNITTRASFPIIVE